MDLRMKIKKKYTHVCDLMEKREIVVMMMKIHSEKTVQKYACAV
jgi:hypothetical protein